MCNLLLSDTEMYFPDAGGGYILSVKAMKTKDGHNKKKEILISCTNFVTGIVTRLKEC